MIATWDTEEKEENQKELKEDEEKKKGKEWQGKIIAAKNKKKA